MIDKCTECGNDLPEEKEVDKMRKEAPSGYRPTMELIYFIACTSFGTPTDHRKLCQKWESENHESPFVWVIVPSQYYRSGEEPDNA